MSRTLIDIDDDALREAQRILGTGTKKDTINLALHEIVRRSAAAEFLALAQAGAFGEPQECGRR